MAQFRNVPVQILSWMLSYKMHVLYVDQKSQIIRNHCSI